MPVALLFAALVCAGFIASVAFAAGAGLPAILIAYSFGGSFGLLACSAWIWWTHEERAFQPTEIMRRG